MPVIHRNKENVIIKKQKKANLKIKLQFRSNEYSNLDLILAFPCSHVSIDKFR